MSADKSAIPVNNGLEQAENVKKGSLKVGYARPTQIEPVLSNEYAYRRPVVESSRSQEKSSRRGPLCTAAAADMGEISDICNDDEQTNVTFDYSHENNVPDQDMKPEEAAAHPAREQE